MWFISAIWPIILVGGIVVFVIKRLEHKYKHGKLGKKKSKKHSNFIRQFNTNGNAFRVFDRYYCRHIFS